MRLLALILYASAAALKSGEITFSGNIVNPACDVSPAATATVPEHAHLIEVAANVKLAMGTAPAACSQGAAPFATRYEHWLTPATTGAVHVERARVTLTYR